MSTHVEDGTVGMTALPAPGVPGLWADVSQDLSSDPLGTELVELVMVLMSRMKRHFLAQVDAVGLSPAQAQALRELQPGHPVPMRELAERLQCDASNVTGITDRLEARGLVERQAAPGDRRVKTLAVTSSGTALREALWRGLLAEAPISRNLTRDEQQQLRDLLRRVLRDEDEPA